MSIAEPTSNEKQTELKIIEDATCKLIAAGEALIEKLDGIAEALYSPQAEVGYDVLAGRQGGAKLFSRIGWLAGGAYEHHGRPTQGMLEVAAEVTALMDEEESAFERLLTQDVAALNTLATKMNLGFVAVPGQ